MLDRGARSRLRTLSKPNADHVARHLVMAGRLVDVDPEVAYEHAREAMRSAGRVDIVREAVALTAYATGRYAEALREVRTVRRLSGIDAHPAIEADCERGLGRPERALAVVAEAKQRELPLADAVEVTIVESELRDRLLSVQADHLEALGRSQEAAEARAAMSDSGPELVFVTDLAPDAEDDIVQGSGAEGTADSSGPGDPAADTPDSSAGAAAVPAERSQEGE